VLLLSLFAAGMVAALAACLLQLSGATLRRASAAIDVKRAFYLAEAGLAEAYSGLLIGKTGNVGTAERPAKLGRGLLWVEATSPDTDHVLLRSTGMCGLGRAVLALVAERGEESVASLGVFSQQPLSIPAGVTISGFDSAASPPPSTPLEPGQPAPRPQTARLGSNGDIAIAGTKLKPTKIYADVSSGPRHTTSMSKDVLHVGKKEARTAVASLPPIEAPSRS
jgi:hypothetical protein